MRLSELRTLVTDEFGATYGPIVMSSQVLTGLGMTGDDALAARVAPQRVWQALCDQMDVPPERRFGRDRPIEHGPGMEP